MTPASATSAETVTREGELNSITGALYVVATPIGNLSDLSARAADVLRSVQIVACEDTRRSRVLLDHVGSRQARLVSCHEHNETSVAPQLIQAIQAGEKVALISDAGTPKVADPGFALIRLAWQNEIIPIPIPGCSAVTAALSVCPLSVDPFLFEGYLPSRATLRRRRLETLAPMDAALVFFEAPHRVIDMLRACAEVFADRRVMVARELTKLHEELRLGVPGELASALAAADALRGEFVIVVERAVKASRESGSTVVDSTTLLRALLEELPASRAAKIVSRVTGADRRALFNEAIRLGGRADQT